MIREFSGDLLAADNEFAIIVSRFNERVTKRLLEGAIDTFRRHGAAEARLTVVWVPGAFEIPLAAESLAQTGKYAAICCLGAVIQGDTTHHEYINQQLAHGIMLTGRSHKLPVIFGVLTCQSLDQALERSGGKAGNKGREAALAAIEMVSLLRKLSQETAH